VACLRTPRLGRLGSKAASNFLEWGINDSRLSSLLCFLGGSGRLDNGGGILLLLDWDLGMISDQGEWDHHLFSGASK
jgi:hypothetical protein